MQKGGGLSGNGAIVWRFGVCLWWMVVVVVGRSITSALMTSPEFKVGRATDGEEEERREEECAGSSPNAQLVRASVEIK